MGGSGGKWGCSRCGERDNPHRAPTLSPKALLLLMDRFNLAQEHHLANPRVIAGPHSAEIDTRCDRYTPVIFSIPG